MSQVSLICSRTVYKSLGSMLAWYSLKKYLQLLVLLLFPVWLLASTPVLAKSFNEEVDHEPLYSQLFNQLLKHEGNGDFLKALRLVPKIYAVEDISVDSFYLTLDEKRSKLLKQINTENYKFYIGKEKFSCASLVRPFSDLFINQVDLFNFKTSVTDDLEFERFCYLMIIEGFNQKNSKQISPVSSKFNLKHALHSSDPWLVSSALFFARKQAKPTISAQAVINRWEQRPDLWDERSTQQAKLFIAQLDEEAVKSLKVSNEDIQLKLAELQAVPSDKSYLSPLLFSSIDSPKFLNIKSKGLKLVKLEKNDKKVGVIKRWVGDKNQLSNLEPVSETEITSDDYENGVISVEPGFYKIKFNSVSGMPPSGYYGQSNIVEVRRGKLIIVPVPLFPAI